MGPCSVTAPAPPQSSLSQRLTPQMLLPVCEPDVNELVWAHFLLYLAFPRHHAVRFFHVEATAVYPFSTGV